MAVSADGELYVLGAVDPFVRAYDQAGREMYRFGHEGVGAGQLKNPWSIMATSRGVQVWDASTLRLTRFDLDMEVEPMASARIDLSPGFVRADLTQLTFAKPQEMQAFGDGFVLQHQPQTVSNPVDLFTSRLVALDRSGTVADTILDFLDRFGARLSEVGSARLLIPVPLWTTCGHEKLAILDPFTPAILWYEPFEGFTGADTLAVGVRELLDSEVRAFVRHMLTLEMRQRGTGTPEWLKRTTRRMVRGSRESFGRVAPVATGMLCDGNGRVWLAEFAPTEAVVGPGRRWRVVDRGEVVKVIRFPEGFTPHILTRKIAIGVYVDHFDVNSPALVSLESVAFH